LKLKDVEIGASSLGSEFSCVIARIVVESRSRELAYRFDIPTDLTSAVSESGNPWAILMLPLACYFGETLVFERPIDRVLHENLLGLRSIWSSWYPEIKPIAVEADTIVFADRSKVGADGAMRTISSFSGGIDSLFTFHRHYDSVLGNGSACIDDLLCVGGFNTKLEDFDRMRAKLGQYADRVGRRLVAVATDIRYGQHGIETPYSIIPWLERLAHGALLASIVHLLGRRYREYIIPASSSYDRLYPWGSHPMCDPLLSASDLRVVHDGASFDRFERTELVARHDDALAMLQVCGRNGYGQGNCSRCQKCLRTMCTLDILGARERAKSFDWSDYSLKRLCHVKLPSINEQLYFVRIAERADRAGRPELASAARSSLAHSRRSQVMLSNPVSRVALKSVRYVRSAVRRALRRTAGTSASSGEAATSRERQDD
jgi:hypothetical protein